MQKTQMLRKKKLDLLRISITQKYPKARPKNNLTTLNLSSMLLNNLKRRPKKSCLKTGENKKKHYD
jgi:hypothetical protein